MSEQEPSEAGGAHESPGWSGNLVRLLSASDTFRLATTEGATRLRYRAIQRSALLERQRELISTHVSDLTEQHELRQMLRLAELEARAQGKLAEWLTGLGDRAGGGS